MSGFCKTAGQRFLRGTILVFKLKQIALPALPFLLTRILMFHSFVSVQQNYIKYKLMSSLPLEACNFRTV